MIARSFFINSGFGSDCPAMDLLEIVKTKKDENGGLWFGRWMRKDATGKDSSPIELMLLGSLRYLGRGWTFDDICEATTISEETHRQFFHIFIAFGRHVLYPFHVVALTNKEEAEQHLPEMEKAGMNGCLASTDAWLSGLNRCNKCFVGEMQQQSISGS